MELNLEDSNTIFTQLLECLIFLKGGGTEVNETDLERYVADKQRAELVKKVRSKINELNIQYIYYQFISVTGRIVGKGIPADH